MPNEKIKNKLAILPAQPGSYLMKDKNDEVIYVGKAIKLKNRVRSYFVGSHNYKTTKLVSNIEDFEFIVTDSEKEALLLEFNLIKKYAPRYNIMFMDDKSYPYIELSKDEVPTLRVIRRPKDKKSELFGPFPECRCRLADDEPAESALSVTQMQEDAKEGMSLLSYPSMSRTL